MGVLAVVGMILFGALGARLWFLQTVESDALQAEVDSAHTETLLIAPERGQIFDADGRLVAGNERVLNIVVELGGDPPVGRPVAIFQRLSGWVDVPVETMEARYDANTYDPLRPLPVAEDVDEETVTAIMERNEDFPGVSVEVGYRRVYPYAPLASHVVGYMGAITAEDAAEYQAKGYDTSTAARTSGAPASSSLRGHAARRVGRDRLRGRLAQPGGARDQPYRPDPRQRHPALGRPRGAAVRRAAAAEAAAAAARDVPGREPDRREARRHPPAHVDSTAGTVRALRGAGRLGDRDEPQTGQIIAMASYPTFDNRWFTRASASDKFDELFNRIDPRGGDPHREDPDRSSLTNRAIQGQYNMGSTFKPFVA